jgi:hypothetical protein
MNKAMKKGELSFTMIMFIVAILALLFFVFWQSDVFGSASESTSAFLSTNDYDGDGLNDAIDSCPCDPVGLLSSQAYQLKKPLPNTGLFKGPVDRINLEDAELIKAYLQEDSIITNLLVSKALADQINGHPTPPKDYFCVTKRVNQKECTYADFSYDFYARDKDLDFAKVCATTKEECTKLIKEKQTK